MSDKLFPTPSAQEGPYYKTGSPERTNIVRPGTVLNMAATDGGRATFDFVTETTDTV